MDVNRAWPSGPFTRRDVVKLAALAAGGPRTRSLRSGGAEANRL